MTARDKLVYSSAMNVKALQRANRMVATTAPLPSPESDPASLAIDAWQPFRGPFQRWPRLMDTLLACLAFFLTLAMWSGGSDTEPTATPTALTALLLAVVGNFALVWRRRHPVGVHAIVVLCSATVLFALKMGGLFAMAVSLYSLGRYTPQQRVSLLGMLAGLLLASVDMFVLQTPHPGSFIALGLVMLFWYVGRRLRFRGEYLRLLEERAEYLERRKHEDARRAVADERTRIARELHDIVAHQVSLMTIQAGAAKTVAASDPQAAIGAMAAVEHAGRQAMTEMRHLLGVLRQDQTATQLLPQPGHADLATLVAEVSEAGTPVALHTRGQLMGLQPHVELALYRIVQEALTNVLRHAGAGAKARVDLSAGPTGIAMTILDDGQGPGVHPGQGHGIAGMRERAQLLGGWLTAGIGVRGGFEVRAFLPCDHRE